MTNPGPSNVVVSATPATVTGNAPSTKVAITYTSVAVMTLLPPDRDGIEILVYDTTGHAHTLVTQAPTTLNAGTTNNKLTWNGTAGSAVRLVSFGSGWFTETLNGVAVS
jgi:hypothetical protein